MKFDQFVGTSDILRSVVGGVARTVNLYLEPGSSKSPLGFYLCPGLSLFTTLGDSPVRVLHEVNGRVFAIAGSNLYEIASNGTVTDRGDVLGTGNASMAPSHTQLIIAAGNNLYCYTLGTNTLTPVETPTAAWVTFCDGYFVACEPDTQKVWISASYDGATWDPLDFASSEGDPDHLVQVLTDHRELIAIGTKTIQPYYNSGAPDFPFEPIQGSMMELGGIAGTFAKLDNSWFWVHQDTLGNGQVWRAEGYRPQRVSDTAVEYALQSLSDLGSAYAWAYQEHGHLYYLITTPTATSTWCYDVLTGLWHERAYWTGSAYQRHRGRCYCRAFDKHLVGDHTNGKVYELSTSYTSDAGDSIRFLRTAPHLHNENKRMFYSRLELHMETGATDPTTIYMRWSNDSGRNYSTAVSTTTGASGATGTRVYWNRLGSARDRVFEVYGLAAGRVGIFGASLDLEPGIS